MKLSNKDRAFSAASLIVTAVTALLLYQESSMRIDRSGDDEIGTLTYRERRAERKYSRHVIWEDLPQSTPVYNYDSIRTADGASARIQLKDGTLIDLDENTLIVLSVARKDISVDFSSGSISTSTGSKGGSGGVIVNSGGTSMALKGDASLNRKDGEIDLSVSSGSAEVKTAGRASTVKKNERATVRGRAVSVRDINIVPLQPGNNSYFVVKKRWQRVAFKWKSTAGQSLLIEVAGDARFRKILLSKAAGAAFTRGFREGTYYWRLRPAKGGEAGPVRKFTVINQEPPRLTAPAGDTEISYSSSRPIIRFSWRGAQRATGYVVEVSRKADFSSMESGIASSGNSVATDKLGEGRYWCRLRADYSFAGTSLVSEPRRFTVTRKETVAAPQLRYPSSGSDISSLSLKNGGLILNWSENGELKSYEVEISGDRNFKSVAIRDRSVRNSYSVAKPLPEGTWYWRVRGYDSAGRATPFSEAGSVAVRGRIPLKMQSPREGDVVPRYRDGGSVDFHWRDPNRGGSYRITVSSDARMKPLLREVTSDKASVRIDGLPAGRLFYMVQLIDEKGKVILSGPVTSFQISASLPEPQPLYPLENNLVNVLNMDALTFTWNPVKGATHYRVTLYSYSGSYSKKLYGKVVSGTGLTLKNFALLDTDTFYWELQALKKAGNSVMAESPVRKSYFAVTLGKYDKARPIIITSPGVVYTE